jgi:peptidyl-prolyl cis-trans isomerase A (cyclophilin A)
VVCAALEQRGATLLDMSTRFVASATLLVGAVLFVTPLGASGSLHHPRPSRASAAPMYVDFDTSLGSIYVELLPKDAPTTVTNFLSYVTSGAYKNTFFSRSVPNFIVQGGGYKFVHNTLEVVPEHKAIKNEYKLPNVAYTLAMAKYGSVVNSATNQWFFNEADNTSLNTEDGGFTVFGKIAAFGNVPAVASINVLKKVSEAKILDASSPLTNLPVIHYDPGNDISGKNLIFVSIKVVKPSS